jgi:hypothetical protein
MRRGVVAEREVVEAQLERGAIRMSWSEIETAVAATILHSR